MGEPNKITKEMTFGEVLNKYPETVKTFFMYGMHCFGCHLSVEETIEQGALAHGVPIDQLIDDLNKTLTEAGEAENAAPTEEKPKT